VTQQGRGAISVVVPVFNARKYLEAALHSALAQSVRPAEIVVVDDGSTDGSAELAAGMDPSVRVVRQANAGPAAARNRGLAECRGDFVAFLDADDLWPPDALSLHLDRFEANPQAAVSAGRVCLVREVAGKLQRFPESWYILVVGCALTRRSVFDAVGPFDRSMPFGEDVDWFYRVRESGLVVDLHAGVTLLYRRHAANMTNEPGMGRRYFLLALKRSLDRRRTGAEPGSTPKLEPWQPEDTPR